MIGLTLIMIQISSFKKSQLSSSSTLETELQDLSFLDESKTISSSIKPISESIKSEIQIKQTREFSSQEILHSQQQALKHLNLVWTRYSPPKIPNAFSTFETPLTRHGNNGKKRKSNSVNHDKSSFFTATDGAALFKSDFKCTRLRSDANFARDPEFLYSSCRFENVCLSRKGNWILYKNNVFNRSELNGKIWLSTSATKKREFNPGKIRVFLRSPPKQLILSEQQPETQENQEQNFMNKKKNEQIQESNSDQILRISKDFEWFSTPIFGFSRHSIGNAGHLILDNFLTLFNMMLDFEYVSTDMGLLFFDDIFNAVTGIHSRAGMDGNLAESNSLIWAKYFSQYVPLQLCYSNKDQDRGYSIGQAPCRQEHSKSFSSQLQLNEKDEIVACFSSLVMGTPDSYFFDMYRREAILQLFRNYLLNNIGLLQPSRTESRQSLSSSLSSVLSRKGKVFTIAIHNKPINTKNKDAIVNVEEIVDYLNRHKKSLLDKVNHQLTSPQQQKQQDLYKSIEIVNLKLENMSFKEMFTFFQDLNIYVSTQGSASYMSLFMLHPEATLIYTPMCYHDRLQCSDYNIRFHEALSNVKTISLMNHLDMIECVNPSNIKKQVEETKLEDEIQDAKKDQSHKNKQIIVRGLPVKPAPVPRALYGSCHERIDPAKLYDLISRIVSSSEE